MQDRIVNMAQLRDHLAELFQLCGGQGGMVPVGPAPVPQRVMDKIFQDKSLEDYLNALDLQTVNAIEAMKNRALEAWNNAENEAYIQELEQQIEQLQASPKQSPQQQAQYRDMQAAAEQARQSVIDMQDRLDHAEQLLCSERTTASRQTLDWINNLIEVRDRLRQQQDWLQNIPETERGSAAKVISAALRNTAEILEKMGVTVMESGGDFDNTCQTVVHTVSAPSAEQVNQIAETFRAGYRYDGEILRAQEVILYIGQQEEALCP